MGSDAPWRREVPWEQDVVSQRVIKINDHIARGLERARGSGLESVSSRIENAKRSERSVVRSSAAREAEGPPANVRAQAVTNRAQHTTRKM